jgi:cytochrome c-type biogenesis protein CcmH
MNNTIEALKQKLAQLKQLHASGVLPDDKFEEGKGALERQILDLVLSAAPVAAAPAAKAAAATPADGAAAATAKPSGLLMAGLAIGVVAIAAAGYLLKGTPNAQQGEAEPQQMLSADGKPAPHATGADQIAAMTEKLAARLKESRTMWKAGPCWRAPTACSDATPMRSRLTRRPPICARMTPPCWQTMPIRWR